MPFDALWFGKSPKTNSSQVLFPKIARIYWAIAALGRTAAPGLEVGVCDSTQLCLRKATALVCLVNVTFVSFCPTTAFLYWEGLFPPAASLWLWLWLWLSPTRHSAWSGLAAACSLRRLPGSIFRRAKTPRKDDAEL